MTRTRTVTRKIMVGMLSSLLVAMLLSYAFKEASAVSLKERTVINGEMITLGDIFEGLPRGADKVLGPAPLPGDEMVINARTLLRVASALDLEWRPKTSAEYIVLTRAASIVSKDDIDAQITQGIKEEGINGLFNLIYPADRAQIILPANEMTSVELKSIHLSRGKNGFEAVLVAPSIQNPIKTVRISGEIEHLQEIPVLTSSMRKGTIIGKRDIEMITIPTKRLNHDTVMDVANLIGKTPRRVIETRSIIKINEVEDPLVVQRGEFVTMIFQSGPLRLTAQGKAMESGAKGDNIRVINTKSNKTVEALVTASREVFVRTY